MATIDSKDDVRELLNNGRWDSGDLVTSIYKYVTPDSPEKEMFACYAEYDPDPKAPLKSPYVKNPVLLMWNGEITKEGKEWFTNNAD
ncbi:MAG: hypothetical protein ACREX4_08460 [Gammaproteobacteria bacterium]